LGTIGDIGIYSFHETKNVNCGEGGAILLNHRSLIKRAEIIREKGTNRSQFFRGEADKYTWVDVGSSYLLSEIAAAYLFAQLQKVNTITAKRKKLYSSYFKLLEESQRKGILRRPVIPDSCTSNYHIFYVLFESERMRNNIMDKMKKRGILTVFHYLPLHASVMGRRFGYNTGDLPITENVAKRLLRLPLYNSLTVSEVEYICRKLVMSI